MKLIIRTNIEFDETMIDVISSEGELLLRKTVSDTVEQYIKELPTNMIIKKTDNIRGFTNTHIISEE